MARKPRPQIPCELKPNYFIGNQKYFTSTFNWMADYIDNLQGEKDENKDKYISIEYKDDTAHKPTITLDFDKLSADIGGGGGGGDITITNGPDTNLSCNRQGNTYYIDVYYL